MSPTISSYHPCYIDSIIKSSQLCLRNVSWNCLLLSTITPIVSSCSLLIGLPNPTLAPSISLSTQQPEWTFKIRSNQLCHTWKKIQLCRPGWQSPLWYKPCLSKLSWFFLPPFTFSLSYQISHALPFLPYLVWDVFPHLQDSPACLCREHSFSIGPISKGQAVIAPHPTEHLDCNLGLRKADPKRSWEHRMLIREFLWDQQLWKGSKKGRQEGQVGCDADSTTAPMWSSAVGMTLDLDSGWPGLCTSILISLCTWASLGHLQQHLQLSPSQKELTAQGCLPIVLPRPSEKTVWVAQHSSHHSLSLLGIFLNFSLCMSPLLEFKCHRSRILLCVLLWPHEWWMNAFHLIFTTTWKINNLILVVQKWVKQSLG